MANKVSASASTQTQTLCAYCGKKISQGQHGALCAKNIAAGWAQNSRLALKAALSVSTVPTGYITIAALHKLCVAALVPVSRMVKATGSDGVINTPAHVVCTPVYYNGTRYIAPWLGTKAGLQAMQTGNYTAAPAPTAWQTAWHNYLLQAQTACKAGKPAPKQPVLV